LKTIFFNLIITRDIEKALETTIIFIEVAKKRVNALERRVNDAFYNDKNNDENLKDFENFIKIIRAEIKTAV
jgi:hypothetical protein